MLEFLLAWLQCNQRRRHSSTVLAEHGLHELDSVQNIAACSTSLYPSRHQRHDSPNYLGPQCGATKFLCKEPQTLLTRERDGGCLLLPRDWSL